MDIERMIADPCQRCGKIGGKTVSFHFGGMIQSMWVCPHCLDAKTPLDMLEEMRAHVAPGNSGVGWFSYVDGASCFCRGKTVEESIRATYARWSESAAERAKAKAELIAVYEYIGVVIPPELRGSEVIESVMHDAG